jgi:hypothetical protein
MGNPRPAGGPRNEEHMNRVAQVPFLTFRSIGSPQHETNGDNGKCFADRNRQVTHALRSLSICWALTNQLLIDLARMIVGCLSLSNFRL